MHIILERQKADFTDKVLYRSSVLFIDETCSSSRLAILFLQPMNLVMQTMVKMCHERKSKRVKRKSLPTMVCQALGALGVMYSYRMSTHSIERGCSVSAQRTKVRGREGHMF